MTNLPQQAVFSPEIFSKPVTVSFSREHLSSNGGSLLLKAVDKKLGLTEAIAGHDGCPRAWLIWDFMKIAFRTVRDGHRAISLT